MPAGAVERRYRRVSPDWLKSTTRWISAKSTLNLSCIYNNLALVSDVHLVDTTEHRKDIMRRVVNFPNRTAGFLSVLLVATCAFAQQPAQNGGWRKLGDQNAAPAPANQDDPAPPVDQNNQPNYPPPPQTGTIPPQVTLKPGTYITVRINQPLSSDRNQAGDAFSATLVRPVIVDGVVVAQSGQTLGGKVTEAKKAGRVEGTSRLGVQLTDLPVVDGQQLPIQTSLISRNGPTSNGRDAGAIAGTTALGAAVGAAAGWGTGAAIGAGAGAVVGTIGVLLTRGHPTYIGPESLLTFRIEQPVTISTEHAPQAFRFVDQNDYHAQPSLQARPYGPPPPAAGYYGPGYAPYPYYGYGYPYYPYWGPGFGVYFGPGFYGRYGFRGGFRR